MKKSRSGNHNATQPDPNALRRQNDNHNATQPDPRKQNSNHNGTQPDPDALRKQNGNHNASQSDLDALRKQNGNHNASQSDSDALRRQTFEKSNISYGDQSGNNSLRFSPLDGSPRIIATPPWDVSASPLSKSPWYSHAVPDSSYVHTGLRGSLVREEGHIYSLAAAGDLLYTGSESKNIRVWKNQKEFAGFKSNSGLVKAIVISGDQIFSGHQDGKIRIWRPSPKNPTLYKRIGSMPTFKAKIKSSFKSSIKHHDAISCLTLSEDKSLLYSGSWDKNFKVWRVSDSKCLESVLAHDDAVNSIIAAFGGTVLTGSADGSIRVWKREFGNKGKTKHLLTRTLLQQDSAVTALATDPSTAFLYGGSSDGTVIFWERDDVDGLWHGGKLRGHKLAVLCLATAGCLVFSGSADTNICVWKRDENGVHTCLSVLAGHGGPVKCLAVEEEWEAGLCEGNRQYMVYSGSIDKSVKIWRATEAASMMQPPPSDEVESCTNSNSNSWADFSNFDAAD